jgi:hypothetical protein
MLTTYCLGKAPAKIDPRTFRMARFLDLAVLPPPPAELDYSTKVQPWPMYANDRMGDCTIATGGHMIQLWSRLEKGRSNPSESAITSVYNKLSPNDQGCVVLEVLKYWRTTGIARHKLFAFAALTPTNTEHVKLALLLLGGVYLGVALPTSAQAQTGPGKVWDVGSQAGGWGGHAINMVAYNKVGPVVVTWGALQQMTWKFFEAYCDEAYALLTADWATSPKAAGIDFAALQHSLAQL